MGKIVFFEGLKFSWMYLIPSGVWRLWPRSRISPMKVSVELIYKAVPSDRELEIIRMAGHTLTSNRRSVSVQVLEKGDWYAVVLEFTMPTQAQYKVVDRVADVVRHRLMEPYEDMGIRFGK
jgi:hypothetical protein